jgi:hypothetical protein
MIGDRILENVCKIVKLYKENIITKLKFSRVYKLTVRVKFRSLEKIRYGYELLVLF